MKPSDGYISYIVNPKSGATSSKPIGRRFLEYLGGKKFEVRENLTCGPAHAVALAADAAVDPDCAVVVAVGGDGTVREVAEGLVGSDKPLVMVPHGTENLLASELGYDERLQTLIAAFEGEKIRPLDMGRANNRCFTSVVGFGFDAEVVRRVSMQRAGNIDYYDYFWPLWRTFWEHRYKPMAVEADGREIYAGPGLVFVGNISRYAAGLKVLSNADYSDGLLDLCIYKCESRLCLAGHSVMTVLRRHARSRKVIYQQCKRVVVRSQVDRIQSEIDGDPGPALPVEIEVIPQAVRVMVPPNAKPAGIRTRLIRAIG